MNVFPNRVPGHLPPKAIKPYPETRYLIVTADDFCCADCIDQGSILGVKNGIVNTLTAMSTYPLASTTIQNTKAQLPNVQIGVHLNITSGHPLSPLTAIPTLIASDGQFFPIERIMAKLRKISLLELELEFRAQIEEFLRSGVPLDHLSYHHNLAALYSPFFDVVMRLAAAYDVPVRNPMARSVIDKRTFRRPRTKVVGRRLAAKFAIRHPFKAVGILQYTRPKTMLQNLNRLKQEGIRHPDHLIDYLYGNPSTQNLLYILNNLPAGTSELIFHLGANCGAEMVGKGVDKHYLSMRERETMIATNKSLHSFLEKKNIKIVSFSDL